MNLKPKQVAEQLGVSLKTVYNLLNSGKLEYFAVGRVKRISQESVTRYIEANTCQSNSTQRVGGRFRVCISEPDITEYCDRARKKVRHLSLRDG